MATSQNGWGVLTSPPSGTLKWITGRVRSGDVQTVFDYYCTRYNAEVEQIRPEWSWGWAYRPIRGSSVASNHSSATACDLNSPAHPLGVRGTFSGKQEAALRQIISDIGVLRHGHWYQNRADSMHAEINASSAEVARVAGLIRDGKLPGLSEPWAPKPKAVHFGRVQEQFLLAAGVQTDGDIVRLNGVGVIQQALNDVLDAGLDVDGYCGRATLNAWAKWEKGVLGEVVGRPRIPDHNSIEELARRAGIKIVGKTWE